MLDPFEATGTELMPPAHVETLEPSGPETRPNIVEVDLTALDHNLDATRRLIAPDTRIHACVKSAAYGCDVVEVAKRFAANRVDALCCGTFDEAVAVREQLPDIDLIMFGATLPGGIKEYLRYDLIPTVHSLELAEAVSHAASKPTRVHIKVDSGWGRLGFAFPYAKEAIRKVASLPNVIVEAVYTHIAFTDVKGKEFAQSRTTAFCEMISELKSEGYEFAITQARASNGVLFGLEDSCNAVALGSILYGKASASKEVVDIGALKPVLRSVRTQLIHVLPDHPGKTVGRATGVHGRSTPPFAGATGVIPFGRRDGFASAVGGQGAHVLIHGKRAPVLAVNSELAVLDLTNVDAPKIGDVVTIVGADGGETVTIDDLSHWQGVGPTDVLVRMAGRTARTFIR